MDRENLLLIVWIIFIAFMLVAVVFEVYIVYDAYSNADEVSCNWIWCEFTEHKGNITQHVNRSSQCYMNGQEVNCSNLDNFDSEVFIP